MNLNLSIRELKNHDEGREGDLPTDCILSFLFPAEIDVLVAVFSDSTDVVVVNFVVIESLSKYDDDDEDNFKKQ